MAEVLQLVLRTLIYQADRKPGEIRGAHLKRGLFVQVERSKETRNYKLYCGRPRHYPLDEAGIVAVQWPWRYDGGIEWNQVPAEKPEEIHWLWTIIKPVEEENHERTHP